MDIVSLSQSLPVFPLLGAEWNLIEPNLGSHIEFESPTPLSNDCTKKEIIRQALVADTANLEITPTVTFLCLNFSCGLEREKEKSLEIEKKKFFTIT